MASISESLVCLRAEQRDTEAVENEEPSSLRQSTAGSLVGAATWQSLETAFRTSGDARAVQKALAKAADFAIFNAYRAAVEPVAPHSAALAVGEYGRRGLLPHAPADVLLLWDAPPSGAVLGQALTAFAERLRAAGVAARISQASLAECLDPASSHTGILASLIDQRAVAGDEALQQTLETKLPAAFARHHQQVTDFLAARTRDRRAPGLFTPFILEPDVALDPGGAEDVTVLRWLAGGESFLELPEESLRQAETLLATVRCFLNYRAGDEDARFSFAAQEELARQPFAGGLGAREWMRGYFKAAGEIYQNVRRALEKAGKPQNSLLENIWEVRSRFSGGDFGVVRERLLLKNPSHLAADPGLAFRAFEFMARQGVRPSADTELRLEAARAAIAAHANSAPLWPQLKPVLGAPRAFFGVRALARTGLLSALVPEWDEMAGLPSADAGSPFTADEHAIRALERIGLTRAASGPFAPVYSELESPAVLAFALLFRHLGASRAEAIMERLGMTGPDRTEARFLLEEGPAAIAALESPSALASENARAAGSSERLKMLAGLAYANPALSFDGGLRQTQVARAYEGARRELVRELETGRITVKPEGLAAQAEFVTGFPVRYLRTRTPAEIESHQRLFELSRPTGAAVSLEPVEDAWRLTIVARDKPSLFAAFTGAISNSGLNVLKAEAFANSRGIVLTTFVFTSPANLPGNAAECERLIELMQRTALAKSESGRPTPLKLQAAARKGAPPPEVRFDSEAYETATLVEINAEDRPGLLHNLALAFSRNGCNIDVVLIDTKDHRAIDLFYVACDGGKLPPELQEKLRKDLVAAC
jgi:[protein-PII] uridylyltransferase